MENTTFLIFSVYLTLNKVENVLRKTLLYKYTLKCWQTSSLQSLPYFILIYLKLYSTKKSNRYRDIIEAADGIHVMKSCTKKVIQQLI